MNIKNKWTRIKNKIFQSETAKKVLSNSSWRVGNRAFTMVVGMFVVAIVARYFGAEKYGQFNYALSFVALFSALAGLGFTNLAVKSLIDKEYDEGTVLCTTFYLRVVAGLILSLFAFIAIRLVEPEEKVTHILVLVMSFTTVLRSLEVIEYWVQAHHKAKITSIIRVIVYVVIAGLKLLLVYFNGNLIHYALIFMLDIAIIGTALFIAYFRVRVERSKWRFNFRFAKSILSKSWPLMLSSVMIILYARIDQVMLGVMMPSKTEVGIYSAAVQIAQMWYFVPIAVINSFKPIIMAKKNIDQYSYLKSMQLLYTILACIGIGFGVIILLFSNFIVDLIYGQEFIKAASILSISIWAGTFSIMGSARSLWLVSENLQKYSLIFVISGAVTNVLLNALMIPILQGYGAAIATLVTQVMVNIVVPLLFKKTRISSIMMLEAFVLKGVFNRRKKGEV